MRPQFFLSLGLTIYLYVWVPLSKATWNYWCLRCIETASAKCAVNSILQRLTFILLLVKQVLFAVNLLKHPFPLTAKSSNLLHKLPLVMFVATYIWKEVFYSYVSVPDANERSAERVLNAAFPHMGPVKVAFTVVDVTLNSAGQN